MQNHPPEKKNIIAWAGDLHKGKDPFFLLNAVNKCKNIITGYAYSVIMAGKGKLERQMTEFIDKNNLTFRHFDTIKAFRDADIHDIYIVFLDFFLSKDRDYGTSLIPELICENLICFSSMKEMCDHMYKKALEMDRSRIRHVYSVKKIKRAIDNQELKTVLVEIFSR